MSLTLVTGPANAEKAGHVLAAYRAALDREEHASRIYAARVAEITVAGGEQEPVASIRRLLPW